MSESFKDKRAVFAKGAQRAFIENVERKLPLKTIARVCECSGRTIRDWKRERFAMTLACVHFVCKRARMRVPKFSIRAAYVHTREAGAKGARALIAKYGRVPVDEAFRKRQWYKWWNSKGKTKLSPQFYARQIRKPKKSLELVEFIGIMMGDGGMSKYQICITLHHINDRQYVKFIVRTIRSLFRLVPSIYHNSRDSVYSIVVSRSELVQYLHCLGLPIGNKVKQRLDIPDWIKRNEAYSIACVRGLVDTDGSIFTHSYIVKGKRYSYKKLSFCSYSRPLQLSMMKILSGLGMRPRMSGHDVRLDNIADMKKYFAIIGSHNPKHLKRYGN